MKLAPETRNALDRLGISLALIESRKLQEHREARDLAVAEVGTDGREHRLAPGAARAWQQLRQAAAGEGVRVSIVSAFRSLGRQVELIEAKCAKGQSIEEILTLLAPPGFSEHHTGQAVDIGTTNCPPAEQVFEMTQAYAWLTDHAARFGFTLSYPRGNPFGYQYEPWHWRFR